MAGKIVQQATQRAPLLNPLNNDNGCCKIWVLLEIR